MQRVKFPVGDKTLSENFLWMQHHTIKWNFIFSLDLELTAKLWGKIQGSDYTSFDNGPS